MGRVFFFFFGPLPPPPITQWHALPASSIMSNNFTSDCFLLLQIPIQTHGRYRILARALYPGEWEAGLSDWASGWLKSDAVLRFGEGHSRVTEAPGSHSAHILTWLITTAAMDGNTLLNTRRFYDSNRSWHNILSCAGLISKNAETQKWKQKTKLTVDSIFNEAHRNTVSVYLKCNSITDSGFCCDEE